MECDWIHRVLRLFYVAMESAVRSFPPSKQQRLSVERAVALDTFKVINGTVLRVVNC